MCFDSSGLQARRSDQLFDCASNQPHTIEVSSSALFVNFQQPATSSYYVDPPRLAVGHWFDEPFSALACQSTDSASAKVLFVNLQPPATSNQLLL
jgi:hypothetical protein